VVVDLPLILDLQAVARDELPALEGAGLRLSTDEHHGAEGRPVRSMVVVPMT